MKIKCIVTVCGTDAYSFPSIDYGNFRKIFLGWCTSKTYQLCSHIAPVHESLIKMITGYYSEKDNRQGIKHFSKNIKASFHPIYYGFNPNKFKRKNEEKIQNSFVTIAMGIDKEAVFLRKGIDLILEVAPEFPNCTFTIIGMKDKSSLPQPPNNVTYIEYIKNEKLPSFLSTQEFYMQISIAEGFPNALCEGMLCECIPIGSDVAGIPTIIGETGFLVDKRGAKFLKKTINDSLKSDRKSLGKYARQRIVDNFDNSVRAQAFYRLIEE